MSKINYELEILGEKKIYRPRDEFINPIIKSKKKIFEITADNSYGKTFILNLIAYALETDKLSGDKVLKNIKDSISRYDDLSSYNLEYNIELDLPDNKILSLSKTKGKGKLIQIDGSPPIGYNVLHKNLSVIYDVPTNPGERLNAVIKDLGAWNNNLHEKIKKISSYFFDISKEFDSVRNEDKIKDLNEKSSKLKKKISEEKKDIENKKTLQEVLMQIVNLKDLELLFKKRLEIETKIARKTKVFKTLKKPSKIEKKDETKIQQLNIELVTLNRGFKDIISKLIADINNDVEISELIEDDNNKYKYYRQIKETELKEVFDSNNYVQSQNKFIDSLDYIRDTILRFISEKKNNKSYIIHNSYKQFIRVLEELMENEIDYLLKTATSVDSIKLKEHLESIINEHKIKDYDALKIFLNGDLKSVKGLMAQFMRTQNQLKKESKKKLVNDDDSKYYQIQGELKHLKESEKKVKNNFELTRATCANNLSITDLARFDTLDKISDFKFLIEKKIRNSSLLKDLSKSKIMLEKEIKTLEEKTADLESKKGLTDMALKREEAKNSSKYSDEQKFKIKKFLNSLLQINNNLLSFKGVITKIQSGLLEQFKDIEDIQFMKLAGKIIAYSMDNKLLRADGVFVELKFYDLVKQEFHCDEDIIIKKDDVSTGLASANYLKQRIDNVDGEYVVVLLDEIGNMAQNAIDKVIESIKSLEKQNRLVLAVFTRPNSNGIKVIEY